jgi:hypothetical protein
MPAIGVKNRTKEDHHLTYDGKHILIPAGKVVIVENVPAGFIESRMHAQHKKNPETGALLPTMDGHKLFETLPLAEAFKQGAQVPEDPSIRAAKAAEEARAKEDKALADRVVAQLIERGWKPPEGEKEKGGLDL